jgi:predicted nuclease of predicted toxin-antitoxin system
MRLKLDENLDERLRDKIATAGHDVSTVRLQGLRGETDDNLFELCRRESRAIVTLDLDFSNVLRYPPDGTEGVIVLRGRNNLLSTISDLAETLIAALNLHSPRGQLWIVEPHRLRIHASDES